MPSVSTSTRKESTGRPRDPGVEQRVFEAAVALYEEDGWAGFSFDAVASRAGVGKSAIYRRWPSKEDLLSDALVARTKDVTKLDTGSLRGDLVQLVAQMLANYTAPHGLVSLRLFVDAPRNEALDRRSQERIAAHSRECAEIFRRAVQRGELPDGRHNADIMHAVSGGALHKVLTTSGPSRTELRRNRRRHAEALVDFALGALNASELGNER